MNKGLRKDKFGFEIMTPKRKHLFGTNTSEEMDSWIKIINEELLGPPKCDVVCKYCSLRLQHMLLSDLRCWPL